MSFYNIKFYEVFSKYLLSRVTVLITKAMHVFVDYLNNRNNDAKHYIVKVYIKNKQILHGNKFSGILANFVKVK